MRWKSRWAGNCEGGRADLISKNPAELSWFTQTSTLNVVNCKCLSDPAMKVAWKSSPTTQIVLALVLWIRHLLIRCCYGKTPLWGRPIIQMVVGSRGNDDTMSLQSALSQFSCLISEKSCMMLTGKSCQISLLQLTQTADLEANTLTACLVRQAGLPDGEHIHLHLLCHSLLPSPQSTFTRDTSTETLCLPSPWIRLKDEQRLHLAGKLLLV